MTRLGVAVGCLLLAATSMDALQSSLDRRSIEEAITIGRSRFDAERLAFHAPYRIASTVTPIDWIDVITPFHRVQLAAEESGLSGSRFGQREAFQVLSGAPEQLDLLIELSFHPLNTFIGVPDYEVALVAASGLRVDPRRVDRVPRFGPRVAAAAPAYPAPSRSAAFGEGQPVLGGTLVVAFDLRLLDAEGRYEIVIAENGEDLMRSDLDLAGLR